MVNEKLFVLGESEERRRKREEEKRKRDARLAEIRKAKVFTETKPKGTLTLSPSARTPTNLQGIQEERPQGITPIEGRIERPSDQKLIETQREEQVAGFVEEVAQEQEQLPLSELQLEQEEIQQREETRQAEMDENRKLAGLPPLTDEQKTELNGLRGIFGVDEKSQLKSEFRANQGTVLGEIWDRGYGLVGGINVLGLKVDNFKRLLTGEEDAEQLQSGLGKIGTIASTLEGIKQAGGDSVATSVARLNSLEQDLNIIEGRIKQAINTDPEIRVSGKYVDVLVDLQDQRTSVEEARAKVIQEEAIFDPVTLQILNKKFKELMK